MNGNRDGMKRARRKLKMFCREYLEGKRPMNDLRQFMESQTAYYRGYDDHGRLLNLRRFYYSLTGEEFISASQRKAAKHQQSKQKAA
jgi:hypothetical protein